MCKLNAIRFADKQKIGFKIEIIEKLQNVQINITITKLIKSDNLSWLEAFNIQTFILPSTDYVICYLHIYFQRKIVCIFLLGLKSGKELNYKTQFFYGII